MRLILVRSKGHSRSIGLSREGAYILLGTFLGACVCSLVFLSAVIKDARAVNEDVFTEWQESIDEQTGILRGLEKRTDSQGHVVKIHLADLKARLLRLEGLGGRLVDVSGLDESEFDFSVPVSIGGTFYRKKEESSWTQLQDDLDSFSQLLGRRETELTILDSVLFEKRLKENSGVGGYPVDNGWTSSAYGERVDPFKGVKAWHAGVDITSRNKESIVKSLAGGVVIYAGERQGYGKLVEIDHANGYISRYGHHQELLVTEGMVIKKGDSLGIMGDTGRSTGPHVHVEVLKNGKNVNPARFLAKN